MISNVDAATVEGFGLEWGRFDQAALPGPERQRLFDAYFSLFSFDPAHEGFDLGCGSGRWAEIVAPRVKHLHCIDPSPEALAVARRRLNDRATLLLADANSIPLPDGSQDFGYSLGVLHHVPDTQAALTAAVSKLRPGGQFLLYMYYALDGRPLWFRALWRLTDAMRLGVSRLPFAVRRTVTDALAAAIYWPLARSAALFEQMGANVSGMPLSAYRHLSFYTMRTDALDRFGTRLEKRFSKDEIATMMRRAGLGSIRFRDGEPFWVAHGIRA